MSLLETGAQNLNDDDSHDDTEKVTPLHSENENPEKQIASLQRPMRRNG